MEKMTTIKRKKGSEIKKAVENIYRSILEDRGKISDVQTRNIIDRDYKKVQENCTVLESNKELNLAILISEVEPDLEIGDNVVCIVKIYDLLAPNLAFPNMLDESHVLFYRTFTSTVNEFDSINASLSIKTALEKQNIRQIIKHYDNYEF